MKTQSVIRIIKNLSMKAISEIVQLLSDSQDPLVKLIAMRKFKYGYGIPSQMNKFAREFKILGEIYTKTLGDYEKYNVSYKKDVKLLTREQEAEVNSLLLDAVHWTYSYWSAVTMARLLIRVGDEEVVLQAAEDMGLFPETTMQSAYSDLIEVLFEA